MNARLVRNQAWHLVVSRGLASIGAALASFGIDVWFYQKTGSYSDFALIGILMILPPIIVSPAAGFITDRASKPKILFWSEVSTALLLTALGALYFLEILSFSSIAACGFLMAVAGEFRYTAVTAIIPEIAKKEELASINGIQQAFRGFVITIGPLLGAAGYKHLGLPSLLGASIIASIYAVYVAQHLMLYDSRQLESGHSGFRGFINDYAISIKWLINESKLALLLFYFTFINGFITLFGTLIIPHVLDFKDEGWLAVIVSAQGAGLLIAGVILARIGISNMSGSLLFLSCHALGVCIILFGISDWPHALVFFSFLIGVTISIISASNQTIWQSCTPTRIQGKIIALRSIALYISSPAIIYFSIPISNWLKAGVLDSPGTPLLGGQQWSSVLFVLSGIAIFLSSSIALLLWRKKDQIISQEGVRNEKD